MVFAVLHVEPVIFKKKCLKKSPAILVRPALCRAGVLGTNLAWPLGKSSMTPWHWNDMFIEEWILNGNFNKQLNITRYLICVPCHFFHIHVWISYSFHVRIQFLYKRKRMFHGFVRTLVFYWGYQKKTCIYFFCFPFLGATWGCIPVGKWMTIPRHIWNIYNHGGMIIDGFCMGYTPLTWRFPEIGVPPNHLVL